MGMCPIGRMNDWGLTEEEYKERDEALKKAREKPRRKARKNEKKDE